MGRDDEIRLLIAREAARLMYEEGVREYRDAKRKAAKRYGPGKALALGAHHAIDYEKTDFLKEAKLLTGRRGVDVVFEHTGKATWERSLGVLVNGGRLVTVGATTGFDPPTDLRHVFYRQLSIIGSTMGSKAELFQVLRFVEEKRLRPVLDRVLPLAEARQAQELLSRREQFGKVVLVP